MSNYLRISSLSAVIILFSIISVTSNAQQSKEKYWVFFKDKKSNDFNPYTYFDTKAIERRIRANYPINHYSDWPVNTDYMEQVSKLVYSISYPSRWFNAVAVTAGTDQIEEVKKLGSVINVEQMMAYSYPASFEKDTVSDYNTELSLKNIDLMKRQTERMGGGLFRQNGIDGKGVRIAIFDAGFPTVDVNPAFEHIRKENRILKTKDFLTGKENVYKHNIHGTMVLSCIAGVIGEQRMGMATGAEFLLARTESGTFEPFSEEENWLAAAEWADKNGADIISSSLGYTYNRYFPWDMDGKKSFVARAANTAAKKGMLVINAAGNDGSSDWKYQGTPADADSVLSIGGIDPTTDFHISFSSFGPTTDKRMKPNVCAFGEAVVAGKKSLTTALGTSFATPLTSGFVACAWQMNRGASNMEMFKKIEQSGDLYPYFDYAHGFGVPQAKFFSSTQGAITQLPTFKLIASNDILKLVVNKNEADFEKDTAKSLLYYHIENLKGYLDNYYVIAVRQYEVLTLNLTDYPKGCILRFRFKGYTESYHL